MTKVRRITNEDLNEKEKAHNTSATEQAKEEGLKFLKSFYIDGFDFSNFESGFANATTVEMYERKSAGTRQEGWSQTNHDWGHTESGITVYYDYDIFFGKKTPIKYTDILPCEISAVFDALIANATVKANKAKYEELVEAANPRDIDDTIKPIQTFLEESGYPQAEFESFEKKSVQDIVVGTMLGKFVGDNVSKKVLAKAKKQDDILKEIFDFGFLTPELDREIKIKLQTPVIEGLKTVILAEKEPGEAFKSLTVTFNTMSSAREEIKPKRDAGAELGSHAAKLAEEQAQEIASGAAESLFSIFVEESEAHWTEPQKAEFYASLG